MRTQEQVFDQILSFARGNEEIRAVVMNGSRTNPQVPQDFFRDYDVVFFVPEPRRFLEDQSWIPTFGDLVILQQNDFDDHALPGYIFLILFSDGVRIDLAFNALPNLAFISEDTLTTVLLDKDGRIPPLLPSSDRGYWVAKPSAKEFAETVNEILWCSNNVAKGIWRDELPYVKSMLDVIIRPCILKMLAWYIASRRDWAIDTGKFGRWLQRYLPAELWEAYLRTYSGPGYPETWAAFFEALTLVRTLGLDLAHTLGYAYPSEDHRRILAYLRHVQSLPPDAISFDGD